MAHHHDHGKVNNIRLAFFLNLGFTLIELVGGVLTNSTAILADAVHDLGDSIALGQAWYFEGVSEGKGDEKYTYGYQRFSLFGGIVSTVILLSSSLYVLSEAVPRIIHPEKSNAQGMVLLALFGVAINGIAMLKLAGNHGFNAKTISLHLLEDVLGWIAVLIVAVVLLFKDVPVLDPILAVLITLYILNNVIKNLRSQIPIILQASPKEIDINDLTKKLELLAHVSVVHHAHIWSLDSEHNVVTAHVVVEKELSTAEYYQLKRGIDDVIRNFGFFHSTIELEYPKEICRIKEDSNCS